MPAGIRQYAMQADKVWLRQATAAVDNKTRLETDYDELYDEIIKH